MSQRDQIDVEWDDDKNAINIRLHDISFAEAVTVFYDSLHGSKPDPEHSLDEYRFLTMGYSDRGRLILISHTDRQGKIRLISARKPTRNERKDYEED